MRSRLVDAFNVWLQVPPESLEIVKQVVGMLHTASLLWVSLFPLQGHSPFDVCVSLLSSMDDVEDDSIVG